MKTMSMRIRGAKTELEEAGESTEGMAESTATLRKEIKALSGVDIMLDENTFKSTYQIMDELSQKWGDLSDIAQATITELVAGKHQGNVMASLMTNFDTARNALETSLGSSGSAMAEHAKWSESLEARLNRLSASWQSLSQSFMNSDFLKVTMDLITGLVDILDKLISSLGSFGTIGLGVGIYGLIKNFGTLKTLTKDIFTALTTDAMSSYDAFIKWSKASDGVVSGGKKLASSMSAITGAIGLVVTAVGLLYTAYKKAREEESKLRQETIKSSNEFLEASKSFERAYIKYSGKTNLTVEEEEELGIAINGTVDALNDKSSALKDVVNSSSDYVASLEQIAKAELEQSKKANEDKQRAAKNELKSKTSSLSKILLNSSTLDLNVSGEAKKIAEKMNSDFLGDYIVGGKLIKYGFTLDKDAEADEIIDYYNTLIDFRDRLEAEGLDGEYAYTNANKIIEGLKGNVDAYIEATQGLVKAEYQLNFGIPKTIEDYLEMRKEIVEGIGGDLETRKEVADILDKEYGKMFDLSSVEAQARKLIGIIKDYGDGTVDGTNEIGTVETFLNMRTAVNNNECTVGEYMAQFDEISAMTVGWSDEEKEIFNTSFSIDTDKIKQQYDDIRQYLMRESGLDGYDPDRSAEDTAYYLNKYREITKFLNDLNADELAAVIDIRTEIDWQNTSAEEIRRQIEERARLNEAMNFTIAINVETEGIDALNTALAESRSATGLTTESIKALESRYKDLDGYNVATLFEETANGIKVNSTELAKLEKEYKNFNKQEADETLKVLKKEYDKLTDEINNCTGDQKKLNDLYKKRDTILDQINNVATLAAQYAGLTSAYNEWQKAQEAGQDRDMYESILSGREEIEKEMSLGWLDDAAVEYLELLTGKDLSTAGIDAQIAAYKELDDTIGKSGYSIWDFFTQDEDGNATSDGVFNFFDTVKSVAGETAAWVDENGKYNFDFEGFEYNGKTGDAAIAEILGTSEEVVQMLLKAAEDAGFVVNIKGDYTDLANMSDSIYDLNEQLKTIGATDYTFNVKATDLDYVNEQITEAQSALQYFENRDGKINLDDSDVRAAASIFATLIYRKSELENPTLMSIDVSEPTTKLEEVLGLAQQLKDAKANLEIQTEIGADTTEAQAEVDSLLAQLSSEGYADIVAGLSIDPSSIDAAIASINAISVDTILSVDAKFDTSKIDGYVAPDKDATVTYGKDSTEVDEYDPPDFTRTVTFEVDSYDVDIYDPSNLTRTVTYKVKTKGEIPEVNGTANANGTAFTNGAIGGRAFKQGNWGIKGSGTALVGEIGTETLVRGGRFYTIGDNGAEFIQYRPNDIIFNHRQTEELFKYGKVLSDGGRGKVYANGSAFADGSAFAIGSNGFGGFKNIIENAVSSIKDIVKDKAEKVIKKNDAGSQATDGSDKDTIKDAVEHNSTSSSSSSKDKDEFEETIDWIETAISRIERAIDKLDQKANNVYKSWSERNSALVEQIGKVEDEIELQQQAYERYLQEANSVGLDSSWAEKVRNGKVDIETITDEALKEKIDDYRQWYEKALDCQDAIEDLKETESELYKQRFENVTTQYDGVLGVIEHRKNMLEEYISQSETQGWLASYNYYRALSSEEKQNIEHLERQKTDMLAELQNAMESGTITKGSEAWYEMVSAIDEVSLSLAEANTRVMEISQTAQQLKWEQFDLLQDKISSVTEESEFLIELLSSNKLYDDNGQLTDKGMATMGLHGQNYNTHMYQADQARVEAERLRAEIDSGLYGGTDKYDTELEERYREMIALQQEHILAAQGEKEAIRDMVEEGINLELDALQERIDKYNEALDSQKDLYEHQKRVKEQTEEIASLEKQMAAYSGDDSEEAKQKIQQLKVDLDSARKELQETEYEKYISDQQQLLDDLYLEYEETLNTRLDNVDALMVDMVEQINANANDISATLIEVTDAVSYTMSESMDSIWNASTVSINGAIATYGDEFTSLQTNTNIALGNIKNNLDVMIAQLNTIAKTNVESASTSSAVNSVQANATKKEQPKDVQKETPKATTSETPTIKVGGKINAGSAKIYDYAGDTSGEGQYFRNDPIYTVLDEKNGYLKVRHHKLSSGVTGWFKKSDVKALATGAKLIDESQLAWTQEKGREFIVRPSDGAILTPVAKGDSVLNATASNNIWDMANSPAEFIKDNLSLGAANVPNNSAVQSSCVQNFENVIFSMPNVHSYSELLAEMQKDKNFEKLILSMSIDRIAGKSSLAKGKSIR